MTDQATKAAEAAKLSAELRMRAEADVLDMGSIEDLLTRGADTIARLSAELAAIRDDSAAVLPDTEQFRIFVESHDGWTPRQNITGEWEIVDRSGWVLATIHYDYRFTSNVTNYQRAHMIAMSPETLASLKHIMAHDGGRGAIYVSVDVAHIARAVLAKLSEGA